MKKSFFLNILVFLGTVSYSQKMNPNSNDLTKFHSSDIVFKWMDMQLKLVLTSTPFIGGLPVTRIIGYTGIALYESVVPGMPEYQSLSGQLNRFPDMPNAPSGLAFFWPANANSALASITRSFFPNTSASNKRSIDSLENALNSEYARTVNSEVLQRSNVYGKSVAKAVFSWAKTDGADHSNDHYIPPSGPGLWVPLATSSGKQVAFGPYWKDNRTMAVESLNGVDVVPLPEYSVNPGSDFYKMIKEVYDVSQSLSPQQKATALYYRDYPGYGDGHYISILKLVLQKEKASLDVSALAYARAGIAAVDAGIACWKVKYAYNSVRPVTYIQNILRHTEWAPLFGTPPFPDYVSGHSSIAGAVAEILTSMFGDNYQFTNNTYSFLGMPDQHYKSFYDMADQIGKSRVYAGIHYTISCTEGNKMGKKVAQNILSTLKFLREK